MTGLVVLAAALVATAAVLGWRRVVDGRFRAREDDGPSTWQRVSDDVPGLEPGERATLLQFSTSFCAPCRATRTLLASVAEREDGVVHVEVDAEAHLALVRELGVLRTPTTLVLDAGGHEVLRASGAPRREQVLAALAGVPEEAA